MEFVEKWGTDVDTAVDLALDELKATRDQVEIKVLEEPSRGFFGIGSKLALVRVELKEESEKKESGERIDHACKYDEGRPNKDKLKDNKINREEKNKKHTDNVNKKTVKDKSDNDHHEDNKDEREKSDLNKDVTDSKRYSSSSINTIIEDRVPYPEENVAIPFLKDVTEKMGINPNFTPYKAKEYIFIDISGKDTGTIIGKRGQTLDAIQYLTNLVLNKNEGEYQRVILDAENYRSKREKTLEQLAHRLAKKAVKTRRSQKLEPMNPYERKVIHTALQNDSKVTTRSEGQDPYRRVIVELK